MPGHTLVLDPAVLIWDIADYAAREHDYWRLINEFVSLLEMIDLMPCELALSSSLAEIIIDHFPADQLTEGGGLHDFVRLIYTFLANRLEAAEHYESATLTNIFPNVVARGHLGPQVCTRLADCLNVALAATGEAYFASHSVVWVFPSQHITCDEYPGKLVSVYLDFSQYQALLFSFTRVYEAHDKHHHLYGYGSRLPESLGEERIQQALDLAVELSGPDCLCARLGPEGVVLVFRRHHQNRYHAYPIEASEYSKYGIVADRLPVSP